MVPNPLFYIFGQGIYLYGICIAVGIITCLIVFYVYTKKAAMPNEIQDYVFLIAIVAIAVGFLAAKFYQAVYDWIKNGYFNFYNAGITFMGGVIGGAAAFLLLYFLIGKFYFKGKKKGLHIAEFNTVLRVAPCCIAIAHAFGRIGCLMAGCCHGAYLGTEYVFGGIWMSPHDGASGFYVPTQLYEALFLFVLFAVLSVLFFKKGNFNMPFYLVSYGVWRIIIEIFRDDYRGAMVLGLSPSQWQSIIFIAAGVVWFIIMAVKGVPFFRKTLHVEFQPQGIVNTASEEISAGDASGEDTVVDKEKDAAPEIKKGEDVDENDKKDLKG